MPLVIGQGLKNFVGIDLDESVTWPPALSGGAGTASFSAVSAVSVDISGGTMVNMLSVNIPAGTRGYLMLATISNLTTASGTLELEFVVDGVVRCYRPPSADTNNNVNFVGSTATSAAARPTEVPPLLVRNNVTIRARKTGVTGATATISMPLIKV